MADSKKIHLLVMGDFAWDVLIRTNSRLLPGGDAFGEVMFAPGGSAANVAVWAQRCGLTTHFIGKIGKDRFGSLAEENLQWENVQAHFIRSEEHRTAAVAVWIDESGQRSMVSGRGADFYLLKSELPLQVLQKAEHLHLSAWSLFTNPPRTASQYASEIIHKNKATLSLDPASFQMISKIGRDNCLLWMKALKPHIFFPNLEEGRILTDRETPQDILKTLAELFPETLLVLKLDARGAMIFFDDEFIPIQPQTENLIDATGAGDAFAGAFLAKYLRYPDPVEAAHFAVAVSSWVVNHIGARPKPDNQLERILKSSLNHSQPQKTEDTTF